MPDLGWTSHVEQQEAGEWCPACHSHFEEPLEGCSHPIHEPEPAPDQATPDSGND
jgi:hypothetical protein